MSKTLNELAVKKDIKMQEKFLFMIMLISGANGENVCCFRHSTKSNTL